MVKNNLPDAPSINLLGAGTILKGDITSSGDFRIDGTMLGSINSKGKIIVGTTGKIDGEVVCQNADISGELKANITVTELLTLKATAKIHGDIRTGKLAIESGASFSGTCSMEEPSFKRDKFVLENEKPIVKEKVL
ncbi:MAG TPA: polymer-forming cytoskeletal protein [Bacteroidales bacterium]|nr:polymer-forming cytoskeletal protein [Bacteroidales bacterium]HNS47685.1 polymer-forming cytoskeletal protein [Bacteroidales bacterium]